MNVFIKSIIFLLLVFKVTDIVACHNTTINSVTSSTNANGSTTYSINVTIDVGSNDGYSYGFALQFSGSAGTPTVMPGFTTPLIRAGYNNLNGYTGSNIGTGTACNYFSTRYANMSNVLTYESSDGSFGYGSTDYTKAIVVTVMGCVQTITLDADFRSLGSAAAAPSCIKTYSTGAVCSTATPTCGTCAAPSCPIAGPYTNYTNANSASNQCSQQQFFTPFIQGATTYTTYHTVTTSATTGTIGAVVSVWAGSTCNVTRSAKLFPTGGTCTSGGISPNSTTANSSTYYNPEWYGLALNTTYVLQIVYTIPAGCDMQDVCVSYYAPTTTVATTGCGSCTTPTCPIGSVATYTNRTYSVCKTGLSITNTTYTEYHTVTADANGNIGVAQQYQLAAGTNTAAITRTAYLLPLGNCAATQIAPTLTNGNGVSSGFNPEWYGLTPGAQYILVINVAVTAAVTIDQLCTDYYGIPVTCPTVGFTWNPTTPTVANLSCSNNTNYRLKANLTGALGQEGQYIAPGFTIDDGGVVLLSNIEVEEGAGTGFVPVYPQITLTYCVPTYQYRIRLTGTGSGIITIIDHATGTVLYSGPFTNGMVITLAPGTIKGTATFSGNGVTNIKTSNPVTYIGSGYGTFNPSLAGAGTHTITYSWNNGQGCSGTSTLAVTVSGTTMSANSATICAGNTATITPTGATSYTYSPAVTMVAANGTTVTMNPTSTTVYTITGITGTCRSYKTVTVTVNPTPTVSVNNATICAGASTVLTAGAATSYSWNTGATTSTISVNPTSTTVYSVTGTTSGCSNTKTVSVTVNPTPTVVVTNTAICSGVTTTLTASAAASYSWNTGAITSTISVNPTSTTVYTVTGTTSGCTNVKTITVTINPTPTVSVSNATICAGASTVLTAGGATSYSWNTGASTSTISVNPIATTVYTVTGTSLGCTNTKTVSVTVGASLTITPIAATVCAGSSATLTASGAASYTWAPSATLNTVNGSSVISTPSITTTYTIVGSNGSCSGSVTVNVTVNSQPTISINSPSVCSGLNAVLTPTGASTYSWSTGSTAASLNVSPTSTTVYTVTGTTGGCSSVKTATITIINTPTINVTSSTICPGGSATLTASGGNSYTWLPGSSTNTTLVVSPLSNSTYTVIGTVGTCTSLATGSVTVGAALSISPVAATVCVGGSATLTASGALNYTWSPSSNLNTPFGASVVSTPTASTTYTIVGSNAACSGSATVNVTIISSPTISVNSSSICVGGSAVLTADGATSYTWTGASGLSGTSGSTVTANPISTTIYTITGSNGCLSSQTSTVTIIANPTISVNSETICAGGITNLTAIGGASYTWSPIASLSSNSGSVVIASPSSSTNYTVIGSNGTCTSSATSSVTVSSALSITPGAATLCAGGGRYINS